ncbi:hypothetical protein DFA_02263 [Cavenderia fasciculata]|uniref:Uncharacterized protein n=1 Tax=Cavenderia fasciculata TaxID=261658 RepID=F4PYZ1_CACFS|nr:uncharacterized protein DFA_02263 [Cavenderia fasciculata]EGG19020.1 hypothetical protein DFA_02263 [Cavenderia fasciculata]|eukprot:XP_004366653.1 hypothetical protein DFA_02263 [Cavenderia fasciculata]
MTLHASALGYHNKKTTDSYLKGRPTLPVELVDFINSNFNIDHDANIVDLASGTGKFTELMFSYGGFNNITCVEPSPDFRDACSQILQSVIDNTEDQQVKMVQLHRSHWPNNSVDALFASQAFHWFANDDAIKEMVRVLKPGAPLIFVWCEADTSYPLVKATTDIFHEKYYDGCTPQFRAYKWLNLFTSPSEQTKSLINLPLNCKKPFPMLPHFNRDSLRDRIFSISYISLFSDEKKKQMMDEVYAAIDALPEYKDKESFDYPYFAETWWTFKKEREERDMTKENREATFQDDEEDVDYQSTSGDEEDDEDYEEMTEEQMEELNRLSSNVNDPFGSRRQLAPAPAPAPAARPAGPTLAELMAMNLKIESDKKTAAGNDQDEGEWIDGEDIEGEEGEEGEEEEEQETMTLSHAKRTASHLVIDTNAIIQATRFDSLARVLWTIEEVIDEVKDKRSVDFLASLPYEIKTKEPTPQSVKAVLEFSKLTGDYPSLSAVDLKVLALAHTLHCQYDKAVPLRTEPLPLQVNAHGVGKRPDQMLQDGDNKKSTTTTTTTTTTDDNNNNGEPVFIISDTRSNANRKKKLIIVPPKPVVEEKKQDNNVTSSTTTTTTTTDNTTAAATTGDSVDKKKKKKKNKNKKKKAPVVVAAVAEELVKVDECCDHGHDGHDHQHKHQTDKPIETPSSASLYNNTNNNQEQTNKKNKKKNSLMVNLDELTEDKPIVDGRAILEQLKLQKLKEEEEKRRNKQKGIDMDGEDGWITEDNIRDKLAADENSKTEKKHVPVALITSDFPMQNVMLQMGLHLFTVNGMAIKQVSQFVLKCFSCLKTTIDMKRMWCPHCGNKTLVKAMKYIDRNGNVTVGKGSGRQYNLRGKKYSIPKMKGGQRHSDIVLSEEQYIHRMKATGLFYRKRAHERKLEKAMESGDLERFETILGSNPGNDVKVGYGKINPNIARRKIGKKNKSILNK